VGLGMKRENWVRVVTVWYRGLWDGGRVLDFFVYMLNMILLEVLYQRWTRCRHSSILNGQAPCLVLKILRRSLTSFHARVLVYAHHM